MFEHIFELVQHKGNVAIWRTIIWMPGKKASSRSALTGLYLIESKLQTRVGKLGMTSPKLNIPGEAAEGVRE